MKFSAIQKAMYELLKDYDEKAEKRINELRSSIETRERIIKNATIKTENVLNKEIESLKKEKEELKKIRIELHLSDFFDTFAYEDILDEVLINGNYNYNNIKHRIDLWDIMVVATRLIEINQLDLDEIHDLVMFISKNIKSNDLNNKEFINAYRDLDSTLSKYSDKLELIINNYKKQDSLISDSEKIKIRVQSIKEEDVKLKGYIDYINMLINKAEEVKAEVSKIFPDKPKNKLSKKERLFKKRNRIGNLGNIIIEKEKNYIKNKSDLLNIIDSLDDNYNNIETFTSEIIDYLNRIEINDGSIKKELDFAIIKLNQYKTSIITKLNSNKKALKTLDEMQEEIEKFVFVDENTYRISCSEKRDLDYIYDVYKTITKESELSFKDFKYSLKNGRKAAERESLGKSKDTIAEVFNQSLYVAPNAVENSFYNGLELASQDQVNRIMSEACSLGKKYHNLSLTADKEAFTFLTDSYTYSIDTFKDTTIVRMHVINTTNYISKEMASFLLELQYNKEKLKNSGEICNNLKKIKNSLAVKRLNGYEMDDEDLNEKFLDNVHSHIRKQVAFKDEKGNLLTNVIPTFAYEFILDKDYHLIDFNIAKINIRLRNVGEDEYTILKNIYDMNASPAAPIESDANELLIKNNINRYFQELCCKNVINFCIERKIPILFYGKYKPEKKLNIKQMREYGYNSFGNRIEEIKEKISSRRMQNTAYLELFKSLNRNNYSLEYFDDYQYRLADMGFINPTEFMGVNFQYNIDKYLFDKVDDYSKLERYQEKSAEALNQACGYIKIEDFIYIIDNIAGPIDVEQVNDEKEKGSK